VGAVEAPARCDPVALAHLVLDHEPEVREKLAIEGDGASRHFVPSVLEAASLNGLAFERAASPDALPDEVFAEFVMKLRYFTPRTATDPGSRGCLGGRRPAREVLDGRCAPSTAHVLSPHRVAEGRPQLIGRSAERRG
jgi:hypothetical protein